MANEKNLKGYGFHERTASEQREIARKGGIASGVSRRERKLIRDQILEKMNEDDWNEYIAGIIARSKENRMDAEFLRDTIGEKPKNEFILDDKMVFTFGSDDDLEVVDPDDVVIVIGEEE